MNQPSASSRRDFVALGALAATGFGMVQDALSADDRRPFFTEAYRDDLVGDRALQQQHIAD